MSVLSQAIAEAASTPFGPDPMLEETQRVVAPRFRLLKLDDLAALPEPEWLIDGHVPAQGLATLFGPSGCGKSFLLLDWALCVASGLSWNGRPVREGHVIYVVAEGIAGFYQRVEAWIARHPDANLRKIRAQFHVIPKPVRLLDQEHAVALENTSAELGSVALVIVDTLARCFVGGDENSARDMGEVIQVCDRIKAKTGATVLLCHHTAKDGKVERGTNSLRGACDSMMMLRPREGGIGLYCDKQKNAPEFAALSLHLRPIANSATLDVTSASGPAPRQTYGIRDTQGFGAPAVSHGSPF